ncbi:MAG: hypothetical protein ACTSYX_00065 [Candidatus Thorarchaeota archaeon]
MQFDRLRARLFVLASLPVLIAAGLASAVLRTGYIGRLIGSTSEYTLTELLVQAVISTVLGTVVIGALFWAMQKRAYGARKIIVAMVVSPMLGFVSIFIGETFLLVMFKGTSSVLDAIVLIASLGVSMMAIALIVLDIVPPLIRNLFVAFYGSVFGSFLGITMVTSSTLVILISVIIEDFFLTAHHPSGVPARMLETIGSDPFDYARVKSESVSVGVGDYVIYSMIVAHALGYFPWFVAACTLFLIIVGILINITTLVQEEGVLPAIPLPAAIAIIPWFVHVAVLSIVV